jgi:hypothetical protein
MSIALEQSEAAILNRVLQGSRGDLAPDVAEVVLGWQFPARDRRRMQKLLDKNQEGTLTSREQLVLENYRRVGYFLDILRAKAHLSMRRAPRR